MDESVACVNKKDGTTNEPRVSSDVFVLVRNMLMMDQRQTTFVDEWLPYRAEYLDELVRLDGRGLYLQHFQCQTCESTLETHRCLDCFGSFPSCRSCMVAQHANHAFHCTEVRFSD